jgi:bis(5'-nucleosidyl)-tetraphosphatase
MKTEINNYDERSAGGVVYRIEKGKIEWLVIKTGVGKGFGRQGGGGKEPKTAYKFPKGHLKAGEFLKQAALREVEEEGRVKAKIVTKIGSNNYLIWDKLKKKKIVKKVTFFLMEYKEESRLKYFDAEVVLERVWLPYQEAAEKLEYHSEKVLLGKAEKTLQALLKDQKAVK